MLTVLVCLIIVNVVHNAALALWALAGDVIIKEVCFGSGPTLLSFNKVRIKLFPFNGRVVLLNSHDTDFSPKTRQGAFDLKPLKVRLSIILSGCLITLLMSILITSGTSWPAFLAAFNQIINGRLHPFSDAQNLLLQAQNFTLEHSFLKVLGYTMAISSSFNLLPLSILNGGTAILALISKVCSLSDTIIHRIHLISLLIFIAMLFSWLISLLIFFFS